MKTRNSRVARTLVSKSALSFDASRRILRSAIESTHVQPLEGRQLLASIAVTNSELVLTGSATAGTVITLSRSADGKTFAASVGGTKQSITARTVKTLKIVGGSGNDNIYLGSTITLPSVIQPGAGNDTVTGGNGNDNVFDPSGNNSVLLGSGNDLFVGGTGNDSVSGNDGNDTAFTYGGADKFVGGNGNDYINAGDGVDTADGGAGTDTSVGAETHTTIETVGGAANLPTGPKVVLASGVLTVTGLAGGANVIGVTKSGTNLLVTANAFAYTYAASSITKIVVTGGSLADVVNVDSTVSTPVSVNGGAGDDTLLTGAGNDSIVGGDGTDRVDGGAGTDNATGVEFAANVESGTVTPPPVTPPPVTPPPVTPPPVTPPPVTPPPVTPPTNPNPPTDPNAATPTPVISAISTSLVVGQALFVNGLSSKVGSGILDTARFDWDFGDGTAKYNKLVGFSAGHIYQSAGTYTVTLKVTNASYGTKTTTLKVNVAADTRSAIYVSAAGSDSNSGTSSGSPIKTYAKAAALVRGKSNVNVLFRAGDSFSVTASMIVGGDNVRIASYGSGAKPVLRWDGVLNHTEMVYTGPTTKNTIVENVAFDSKYPGPDGNRDGMPHAISPKGIGFVVRNVTFYNLGYDINTNAQPTGVFVQDCDSPTTYGLRSYLLWAQGSDFVVLGNKVANSTNEHPIRVFGVNRMLIAYNDLANPQYYSFETSKTAMNVQKGQYIEIYGNTLRGPRWQVGPLGGADGVNDKSARLKDVIIENNTILNTEIQVYHGAENIYVKNNVFTNSGIDSFEVEGFDSSYNRGVVNLNIINNTIINTGTSGRMLNVEGSVNGITVVNNVYSAPNMAIGSKGTAAIFVQAGGMGSFTKISNNIWPVPASTPSWLSAHTQGTNVFALIGANQSDPANYYSIARWNALAQVDTDYQATTSFSGYKPNNGAAIFASAINRYAGIFTDYYGNARPLNDDWTIGAVQV